MFPNNAVHRQYISCSVVSNQCLQFSIRSSDIQRQSSFWSNYRSEFRPCRNNWVFPYNEVEFISIDYRSNVFECYPCSIAVDGAVFAIYCVVQCTHTYSVIDYFHYSVSRSNSYGFFVTVERNVTTLVIDYQTIADSQFSSCVIQWGSSQCYECTIFIFLFPNNAVCSQYISSKCIVSQCFHFVSCRSYIQCQSGLCRDGSSNVTPCRNSRLFPYFIVISIDRVFMDSSAVFNIEHCIIPCRIFFNSNHTIACIYHSRRTYSFADRFRFAQRLSSHECQWVTCLT